MSETMMAWIEWGAFGLVILACVAVARSYARTVEKLNQPKPAPPADPEGVMPWETERRITQVAAINRTLSELLAQDHDREAARLRHIAALEAMRDRLVAAGHELAAGYPAKAEEWAAAVSTILEGRAPAAGVQTVWFKLLPVDTVQDLPDPSADQEGGDRG